MGQGGQGSELVEIDAATRLAGFATKMGGRDNVRLDLSQPSNGEGLREVVRHRRGIRLRGDDAAYAEAVGTCVGVSRQSLEQEFSEVRAAPILC